MSSGVSLQQNHPVSSLVRFRRQILVYNYSWSLGRQRLGDANAWFIPGSEGLAELYGTGLRDLFLHPGFPKDELYGLASQLRRAAVSVASKIAEGKRRSSDKEFVLFLHHARGSLFEIGTRLAIAKTLSYLAEADLNKLSGLAGEGRANAEWRYSDSQGRRKRPNYRAESQRSLGLDPDLDYLAAA